MTTSEEPKQACPTRYRGTEFRAKNEAVFARAITLCGYDNWDYEPCNLTLKFNDSVFWSPDFILWLPMTDDGDFNELIIEYKPSKPQDWYITRFCKNIAKLSSMEKKTGILYDSVIVYGNPWDDFPNYGCIWATKCIPPDRCSKRDEQTRIIQDIIAKLSDAIRYDFDIERLNEVEHISFN